MLHIGDNRVVAREDIIVILPENSTDGWKSRILLGDGQVLHSSIASATLKRRLDGGLLPKIDEPQG